MFKNKALLWLFSAVFMLNIAFAAYDSGTFVGSYVAWRNERPLMDTPEKRVSMIIPVVLLLVSIVSFAIDLGTIGVTVAAIVALVVLQAIGIVAFGIPAVSAYILLGVIIIFKVNA
jgi:hypothetical protein